MNKNSVADNHKMNSSDQNTTSNADHQNEFGHSDYKMHKISVLTSRWSENSYITSLNHRISQQDYELEALKHNQEYLKTLYFDSQNREKILLRRLVAKELLVQTYAYHGPKLVDPSSFQTTLLLDPCVNIVVQLLCQEVTQLRFQLKQTREDFAAWQFTPDSITGRRLLARCRHLHKENEELGRLLNSGKLAKLENGLALQKNFSEEVRKSQLELDNVVQDLDEDVENMQSTIYALLAKLQTSNNLVKDLQVEQQQREENKARIEHLELENRELKKTIEKMEQIKLEDLEVTINNENTLILC